MMPDPAKFKHKKNWMRKCLHQVLHRERKEKEHGLAQCLNMWRQEHGGKPAPKKKKKCVAEIIRKIAEDIRTADYPDHPDDVVISKGENIVSGPEIKEIDVWSYYEGIKSKIIPELKSYNLFVVVKPKGVLKPGQKPVYIRRPYDKKTEFIRINNEKDFETYHSGRTVEYHVTTPASCPWYIVDFDAVEDWSETKKITAEIADALADHPDVKSIDIQYTGKRGFHVIGWLKKAKPVDTARENLKDWLKEKFGDRDDLIIGESPKGKKGALGVSPMKLNGGHVAKWSMRASGLCCVDVPRKSLMSFKKENAAPDKVFKQLTGRALKPIIRKEASMARRVTARFLGSSND